MIVLFVADIVIPVFVGLVLAVSTVFLAQQITTGTMTGAMFAAWVLSLTIILGTLFLLGVL
jgi:hypothetical protein